MRHFGNLSLLLPLLLSLLPSAVSAQVTTPMPPGIRYQIGGHAAAVNDLVVSKDGTLFASASLDGTVKVWQMADGALLHTYATGLAVYGPETLAVALSPDGTTIAAGDVYNNIWMWRLADDSLIREFSAFNASGGVTSLSYSPDGTLLAASGTDNVSSGASYTIKLFSTANGHLQRTLKGHTSPILQIAYAPTNNGVLASISNDLTLRVWNTNTGATTKTIKAFTQAAYCLAFSSDGTRVAAGGQDSTSPNYYARVWNASTGSQVVSINAYNGGGVTAVAFSPDGTLLATGGVDAEGNFFYLPKTFNIASGALVNTFGQTGNAIQALAFSIDGTTLISAGTAPGGYGGQIVQWSVASAMPLVNVTELATPIANVAFSSDAQQMAMPGYPAYPVSVQSFALADGTPLWSLPGQFPFCFSPDNTLFVSSGNPYRTIFDLSSLLPLVTINAQSSLTWLSDDNQTAYIYFDPTLTSWKLPDGTLQNTIQIGATNIAISADQTRMVGLNTLNNQAAVWSLPSGALVQTFAGVSPSLLAISSDGNYIAIADLNTGFTDATIYRVSDGALMLDQPGAPGATVQALAISPFGDSVAAYRSNGSATVTGISPNSINGTELAYWNDQLGTGIASIGYTPDGASIVLGRTDATALVCYNPAPAALASFSLNQSQAAGGVQTPAGTVILSQAAPSGGLPVTLVSSNPAVASVPASVLVAQNSASAIFAVTTFSVSSPTPVTLTAIFNGVTRSVNLTVNPAVAVKALSFAPSTLQGGQDAVGVVTLKSPAYSGGVTVSLVSANPGVVGVSTTVTVAAGTTSASFGIETGPVTAVTPVAVTATAGGTPVKATITVAPATVAALSILPKSVMGGVENAIGIVTLGAPATTDTTVAISVTTPKTAGYVSYPVSITVPAGSVSAVFDISTNAVTSNQIVTFSAQIGVTKAAGTTFKTANLTLIP